jgi:hypothetical protein
MVKIVADYSHPLVVYAVLDMPFAVLVCQIASALTKK